MAESASRARHRVPGRFSVVQISTSALWRRTPRGCRRGESGAGRVGGTRLGPIWVKNSGSHRVTGHGPLSWGPWCPPSSMARCFPANPGVVGGPPSLNLSSPPAIRPDMASFLEQAPGRFGGLVAPRARRMRRRPTARSVGAISRRAWRRCPASRPALVATIRSGLSALISVDLYPVGQAEHGGLGATQFRLRPGPHNAYGSPPNHSVARSRDHPGASRSSCSVNPALTTLCGGPGMLVSRNRWRDGHQKTVFNDFAGLLRAACGDHGHPGADREKPSP